MDWIFAITLAFAVGMVSAVFGVGGGFILVPVLSSMLGVPMNLAVGSSVSYVLGPATTALLHRQVQWREWRLPLILSGGLFVGVVLGGATLNLFDDASESSFNAETLVLSVYLVLLGFLGLFSLWETEQAAKFRPISPGWLNEIAFPPTVILPELNQRKISIPVYAWFGVVVGFISGLLGISGGLLIVPGLLYLFAVPTQQTVVTSMIVVWIVSIQSTVVHAWSGNVDLQLVAALLAGGTVGARFGSSLGKRLGSQQLRRNFGMLALGTAIFVGIRLLLILNRSN